jgi:hypothetical protein
MKYSKGKLLIPYVPNSAQLGGGAVMPALVMSSGLGHKLTDFVFMWLAPAIS